MTTAPHMNKTILITGGASGIGAATARLAAAAGYHGAINYRSRAAEAAALVGAIERGGGRAVAIAADVAKPADIARLFAETERNALRSLVSESIGVQQITELLLIPGIDFVGPLPKELQANIIYATATPTSTSPTTPCETSCIATTATARSRMSPTPPASGSTPTASRACARRSAPSRTRRARQRAAIGRVFVR